MSRVIAREENLVGGRERLGVNEWTWEANPAPPRVLISERGGSVRSSTCDWASSLVTHHSPRVP